MSEDRDAEEPKLAVPADLMEALAAEPPVREFFESLSYSTKRGFVDTIAKASDSDDSETRTVRIERTLGALREARKR